MSRTPYSLLPRPFSHARTRRRVAFFLAFAVLFAGIAQAAHYHKGQLAGQGQTDVHCLLCLFAGSNAGPPVPAQQAAPPTSHYCGYRLPVCIGHLTFPATASYDARGPPIG